jgi:hypothetical protein
MSKDNVDIWLLETLERALEALDDVFARETTSVRLFATCAKEDLGRQDIFVTWPVEFLESITHFNLGFTVGVRLGSVEEVDAVVPSSLQTAVEKAPVRFDRQG